MSKGEYLYYCEILCILYIRVTNERLTGCLQVGE